MNSEHIHTVLIIKKWQTALETYGLRVLLVGESAYRAFNALSWETPVLDIVCLAERTICSIPDALRDDIARALEEKMVLPGPFLDRMLATGHVPSLSDLESALTLLPLSIDTLVCTVGGEQQDRKPDDVHVLDVRALYPEEQVTVDGILRATRSMSRYNMKAGKRLLHVAGKLAAAFKDMKPEERGAFLLDILGSDYPSRGLAVLHEAGILESVFPRLAAMAGVEERTVSNSAEKRKYHHKDVFYHTLQVVDNICEKTEDVWLRMAALYHDVGKPRTKAFDEQTGWTFHGHAEIGERMVKRLFREYGLDTEKRDYVRKLVALHLRPMALVSEGVTDSAVRRLITDAGEELEDLLTLCRCDITSKNPGRVTRYLANYDRLVDMIHDVVQKDAFREWQPPVTGQDIMDTCGIAPGVMVGILKNKIEDAILAGEIHNDREAALRYLQEIKDDTIAEGTARKPKSKRQSMKYLPENLRE